MKLHFTITFQPAKADNSELSSVSFPIIDRLMKVLHLSIELSSIGKYLDEILYKVEK